MSFNGIRLFVFLITGKYVNFLPLCILFFFFKKDHTIYLIQAYCPVFELRSGVCHVIVYWTVLVEVGNLRLSSTIF